jgi:hypothetical protein
VVVGCAFNESTLESSLLEGLEEEEEEEEEEEDDDEEEEEDDDDEEENACTGDEEVEQRVVVGKCVWDEDTTRLGASFGSEESAALTRCVALSREEEGAEEAEWNSSRAASVRLVVESSSKESVVGW